MTKLTMSIRWNINKFDSTLGLEALEPIALEGAFGVKKKLIRIAKEGEPTIDQEDLQDLALRAVGDVSQSLIARSRVHLVQVGTRMARGCPLERDCPKTVGH